jgi:hypothetical protein
MVIPEIRPFFPKSDLTNVWNHTQFQGDGINGVAHQLTEVGAG